MAFTTMALSRSDPWTNQPTSQTFTDLSHPISAVDKIALALPDLKTRDEIKLATTKSSNNLRPFAVERPVLEQSPDRSVRSYSITVPDFGTPAAAPHKCGP